MELCIKPLTSDLWPAFEELFGSHGACNGCWCMYWRIGSDYHKRSREYNKQEFQSIVQKGPPPGLVAFENNIAVGWCQLTTKRSLAWLEKNYGYDDTNSKNVWCISCFYIKRGYRKKGVTSTLIENAIEFVKLSKGKLIEAYPIDSASSFTGFPSTFQKAGFKVVTHGKYKRIVMRLIL
jgi:predicted GNAT family acetyltransferase